MKLNNSGRNRTGFGKLQSGSKSIVVLVMFLCVLPIKQVGAQQAYLLTTVGRMVEQQHYARPVIDDRFSEEVWKVYIDNLDGGKRIFLEEDMQSLGVFRSTLDNEIHGDSIRFFPAAITLFLKRYDECVALWRSILKQPFRFNPGDSLHINQGYKEFATDAAGRERRWKFYFQQRVFDKLVLLQEQRRQSKKGDTLLSKSDAQLEQIARAGILRQQERLSAQFHNQKREALFAGYLNAIVHYTDPHSDYFPPVEKQEFDQMMANRFYGIGLRLSEDAEGRVTIAGVEEGGPAARNGLFNTGDQIVRVGQDSTGPLVDVEELSLTDIVRMIRGKKGTIVQMGCRRADGTLAFMNVVREEIKQEEAAARSAVIGREYNGIGYILLPSFYDDYRDAAGAHCADDVERELKKLMAANIHGLIIDLRNNGGGSLAQVIQMVGLFTGNGPVVQVRSANGQWQALRNDRLDALYKGPLTVLVNEFSASASEIFAAAIQDYGRGLIVGSNTFGKGTVQRTLPLGKEEYGALKLTMQKFYRVNGGSTQLKGVVPDIALPDSYETLKLRECDKPFALQWDQIEAAGFAPWTKPEKDSLQLTASKVLTESKLFDTIRINNNWLGKYLMQTAATVQQKQYLKELMQRNAINKQLKSIVVLPKNQWLAVRSEKQEWADKIAADIYIKQALLITAGNTSL